MGKWVELFLEEAMSWTAFWIILFLIYAAYESGRASVKASMAIQRKVDPVIDRDETVQDLIRQIAELRSKLEWTKKHEAEYREKYRQADRDRVTLEAQINHFNYRQNPRDSFSSSRIAMLEEELKNTRNERDTYKALAVQFSTTTPAAEIPKDQLRRLIQLCHPDKHNGSQAAQTATEWLLKQRRA